ncbi:hypothetical protein ACMT4L_19030 [Deinococcus sp. A31D244]|uniref:hypothetical protein n=1 Tax=Deinococcus sp. A31D244 TaxID=3397675 RepID=UPI0039E0952D
MDEDFRPDPDRRGPGRRAGTATLDAPTPVTPVPQIVEITDRTPTVMPRPILVIRNATPPVKVALPGTAAVLPGAPAPAVTLGTDGFLEKSAALDRVAEGPLQACSNPTVIL